MECWVKSHMVSRARLEYCPENLPHNIEHFNIGPNIATLLVFRPVVVGVEGRVVEVEEPQPVSPRHVRVATDRVILKQIFFIQLQIFFIELQIHFE